ncbi:peptidase M16 [Mesotoga sp. Brook.08.YT.4.2.5.1]|uniref:M16 family metallopeptidase n=1 Tax=unclassified Mesotoga TaxID=1184398 RepID=UPI000C198ACF|nr:MULTISPECIES: pitrilysin family protein [unclassified Mesotoga]RAM59127.1 peptidase M16 [Mesotoga sp. SC_4PWL113PWK15]PNE19796.1 peptidase M16 [Mesotoga sp. Brook.08.YT.4.2.5.1]PVD15976.1 peptidase M16 [Mesotoga sp. Brook.08.105.5.1]RAO97512.1 peptidase M16 [Mesotoga sp. Brook.08.YT.4.2.5.4.]RDI94300.1 peptidase M16 [Mesotoga sp. Brook.08.YT.4.2.5.2.]
MNNHYIELPNGAVIIGERKEETRTVSMAFAMKVGSADEDDAISGVSHFIEHALFKGTLKRNAFEIKEPIERIGGSLNAYTGRVSTVYYAKVPDTYSLEAMEILFDLITSPRFDEPSLDLERGVILEEIASAEDDPYDRIYDMTIEKVWDRDFGRPILGYQETIEGLERSKVSDFYGQNYVANNAIFAVSGNYGDELLRNVEDKLLSMKSNGHTSAAKSPVIADEPLWIVERRKDLQQVHILLTRDAPGRKNKADFDAFKIFNTLFGSGMSSILFHNIREELGMVYNISSEFVSYADSGAIMINATTSPKNLDNLVSSLKKEMDRLIVHGATEAQFNYGKERARGKLLMSTEGTLLTLSRFLDDVVICGKPDSLEDLIARIDRLTIDDVNASIKKYIAGKWNVSLLLPEKKQQSTFLSEESFEI